MKPMRWSRESAAASQSRRRALRQAAGLLLAGLAPPLRGQERSRAIRIGITAVILNDQVRFLEEWARYLQGQIGRPVSFVHRSRYREITELLLRDELDFAWVCGYPYVSHRPAMRLLAVPLYQERPWYRSYLIVPSPDLKTSSFADLKGEIFAYSDPSSNSGFLVPQYEMLRAGLDPLRLFRKSFFTYAHGKVVAAVANGIAHGGAVDGYVWETLALRTPELTRRTRVAAKSEEYGFPPLVARRSIDEAEFRGMQKVLSGMPDNPTGQSLLKQLNLDGFAQPEERVFDGIARILAYVSTRQRLAS
ncbi:MAG: PhnD/SsuA/transferrin family substrate-binding protein [Thiobacillus sp.]